MADKMVCSCCGGNKDIKEYYSSYSTTNRFFKKLPICKDCVLLIYNEFLEQSKNEIEALYDLCRVLDCYFDESLYNSAKAQAENKKSNPIQTYFQKINSLPQYRLKTYKDSTLYSKKSDEDEEEKQIEISHSDKKNEEDVLRMLGYDPFESENFEDKKYLFNRLVDYLDESTLEDSFKLSSSIELVKTFNQIDKLNMAIASITANPEKVTSNVGGIKSLIDAKNKLYSSALGLAKDNGISVNHNNNKSKGSGTLTGIIKKLEEIGLDEAMVNLFDIETCNGIEQVANISNENIRKQIMFDENDYSDMLAEQRKMIENLDKKSITLEEENRLLKIKLKYFEDKE